MHTMRSMTQPNATQWSPSLVADPDPLGPYVSPPAFLASSSSYEDVFQFASPQERNLVGHSSPNVHDFRYQ